MGQLDKARPSFDVRGNRDVGLIRQYLPDEAGQYCLRPDLHKNPRPGLVHGKYFFVKTHGRDEVIRQQRLDRGWFVWIGRRGRI
jgi:hypothetical protein